MSHLASPAVAHPFAHPRTINTMLVEQARAALTVLRRNLEEEFERHYDPRSQSYEQSGATDDLAYATDAILSALSELDSAARAIARGR